MEYIIICFTAFLGAALTLVSGFGLGTLLLPVFGLFFPIEIAISLTALVHFLNNIFKFTLYFKCIHYKTVLAFGIPALIASFFGAFCLTKLTFINTIISFKIANFSFETNFVKITISIILLFFTLFEILPYFNSKKINPKYIVLGGILSGFFGGLSGHQGALRTAFLSKLTLNKNTFLATGIAIACLIDISRLTTYFANNNYINPSNFKLVLAATLSAFLGVYLTAKKIQKVTLATIQKIVSLFLILFSIALLLGIV